MPGPTNLKVGIQLEGFWFESVVRSCLLLLSGQNCAQISWLSRLWGSCVMCTMIVLCEEWNYQLFWPVLFIWFFLFPSIFTTSFPFNYCSGLHFCYTGIPAFQAKETAWSRWAKKTGRWAANEEATWAGVWLFLHTVVTILHILLVWPSRRSGPYYCRHQLVWCWLVQMLLSMNQFFSPQSKLLLVRLNFCLLVCCWLVRMLVSAKQLWVPWWYPSAG